MYDYDLFTIGAGSGGVAASRRAGAYGARVGICEDIRVGGTCVLRGCIPKKLLVYASEVRKELADAAGYGWRIGEAAFDWPTLMANKNAELDRLNGIYLKMLADAGVELFMGRGKLIDAHTVEISGPDGARTVTAETILVATGGWPEPLDLPGVELAISSNEALDLAELPSQVVIIGGGYVAVEFAGIFHNLGAQVTQIIRRDLVLRGFDDDVRRHLQAEMAQAGVRIAGERQVREIRRAGDALEVEISDDEILAADVVLCATGRRPRSAGVGLEEVGVVLNEHGAIQVDGWSRTAVPNIYSVGDCTDRFNLTPVAIAEGRALVETLYNDNPQQVSYEDIPTAVFSQPPVATVGLGEAEARQRVGAVAIYQAAFRPLKHTLSGDPGKMFMKMVVDAASERVLGVHMVGDDASEVIQALAIALKAGARKSDFDATMGIHPTAAEEFVTMYQPAAPVARAAE